MLKSKPRIFSYFFKKTVKNLDWAKKIVNKEIKTMIADRKLNFFYIYVIVIIITNTMISYGDSQKTATYQI